MAWDDGNPYVEKLVDGVYAYIQPDGGWMVNNCGVVVDGSGTAVLVDTTSTERRNRAVLAEVADRVPGVRTWLWVDDGSGPCPDWATASWPNFSHASCLPSPP